MVKRNKCYRPQLVIPQTFEQCFTYEKQVLFLKNEIDKLKTQVDTSKIEQRLAVVEANLAMLSSEVAEINVDNINAQLQSINAELTQLKNTSSAQADSITDLQTAVAGKQNTLTFDSTPTAGSTNPVTSGGIRTAIDEAGGSSRVEWVETNLDAFLASLPNNVAYTTDVDTNNINSSDKSLIPDDIIKGTFTQTGMFISSDKRYLKIVLNVTGVTVGGTSYKTVSYSSNLKSPRCPFTYCVCYATITQEGGDFMFISNHYGIGRTYKKVNTSAKCSIGGVFKADSVTTCSVYFKLLPGLPIDLM